MTRLAARILIAAALALPAALSGCAAPERAESPELSYRHLAPINLAAGTLEVVNRYVPPLQDPNVEHRSPVPPYTAAIQWGHDRLRTQGGPNHVRLVIEEASIVATELPVTGGIKGLFQRDQARKYDGRMAVTIELLDPDRRRLAFATAKAERSQTVAEGATVADREKLWFAMTETMMRDINAQLEQNIQRYFGPYLVRG